MTKIRRGKRKIVRKRSRFEGKRRGLEEKKMRD